ncbi:MAG: ATP-dependent DNA helicase [Nanoarchaeota archaeon]
MSYIEKVTGPCVILAGAGTGKTRSIIEKLKHLINNKTYPIERVVCLTFSNEAVNTLIQRILPFLKEKEPIIKTFHSFCAELLRNHGMKIGINPKFKIILPDDGKILLHKYFKINPYLCNKYIEEIGTKKDLGTSLENYSSNKKTSEELEFIAKRLEDLNFKINTAHLVKIPRTELDKLKEEKGKLELELNKGKFYQAWNSYEKIKSTKNGLDYNDLHHKALELLNKHPEIANDFDYIIVDEFQDTNKMQCLLLDKIAKKRNITVVGDLNQSIYGFRGAYDQNFSYFKEIMNVKETDIYALDKSYRSTNKILSISHDLIKNNYSVKEDCFEVRNAYNETGENIKVYELKNSKEEIRKITELIKEELTRGTSLKEICVIFRTHQQSNPLKKHLEYENIPYTSVNKESLLKIPLIKYVRAYLTIVDKILNKSKGGDSSWWELVQNSAMKKEDKITLTQKIRSLKDEECLSVKLVNEEINELSKEGETIFESIKENILSLSKEAKPNIKELTKKIYECLASDTENEKNNREIVALERFYEFVSDFSETDSENLTDLIYHLYTIDTLQITLEAPSLNKEGIRIMTNHATKGLEYESVIISSMVQKKFPMEKHNEEESMEKQIMEERRLCYVGFTRTKKRLYLTYAKEYSSRLFEPSQFLKEINYQNNQCIDFTKDEMENYKAPPEEITEITKENNLHLSFSPSALQTFDECQKRYEMKYVYNMPDPSPQSWEAITLGTFIHRVLDKAVSKMCKTQKEIEDCARIVQMEEYKDINLDEAMPMIKIFFERNKKRYNENSLTEEYLEVKLDKFTFRGYADRIDISDNGDITIIDYKTGKSDIKPRYRNWQLGIYALASKHFGNPKSLVLDMLQKEYPLEFELNSEGIAIEVHSPRTRFSLKEVESEIIETARKISLARKTGFKKCNPEKNCQFCNELENQQF